VVRGWENGESGVATRALAGGYRGLLQAREWLYQCGLVRSRALPCPVVSIGNLTVGGTGKTPAVEYAVRTLCELGARPAIVSRGYRRRSKGVQVVADGRETLLDAEAAGDESWLLARRLPGVPVVVAASRYEGARLGVTRFGATAVVLDDGFQHRSLVKDLDVVLVRAASPWGNGRLLPAGPLREPLEALARAHLIVVTGGPGPEAFERVAGAVSRHAPGVPVIAAVNEPVLCRQAGRDGSEPATVLAGRRLFGFAGIAWPESFRRTLEAVQVVLCGFQAFPDHFWYSRKDLDGLIARAERAGAEGLVTTEKDWVRLGESSLQGIPLYVLGVRFTLLSGTEIWNAALSRVLR